MIFARRDKLPRTVRLNKAGTVSLLSFVRSLGLPDNVRFSIVVDRDAPEISLRPILDVADHDEVEA